MDINTQIVLATSVIIYILNILKYLRNPLNYSNKKTYNISYHNIYFAFEIIIIIFFTLYLRIIHDDYQLQEIIPKTLIYIPIVIATLIIISYKRKPIEDMKKFNLKPENLSKHLLLIIIILIICSSISLYITKNIYLLIILLIYIITLYNNYGYQACKFDLPKTFNNNS